MKNKRLASVNAMLEAAASNKRNQIYRPIIKANMSAYEP